MLEVDKLREALSYDPLTGVFVWRHRRGPIAAGAVAGTVKADGYRAIQFCGREWHEHRLAWAYVHGSLPEGGVQIDHKNLVKSDNRIENLRLATRAQQQANTRLQSNNRHGAKGMKWRTDNKCWRVDIYVDGKPVTVGHFKDKCEAANAYEQAAIKYYGEFARSA